MNAASPVQSTAFEFLVRQDDLGRHCFAAAPPINDLPLETQDVVLRVDRFAFTANNITYAVLGRSMSYFSFFPAQEGWARIPVWGMGTVARTSREDVPEGARFYGYYPMSTYVVVRPSKASHRSFVDDTPVRRQLFSLYNSYWRMLPEYGFDPDLDLAQLLLRPVFITSFILDDLLEDERAFGAEVVAISSASSKTSIGLAHLQAKRRAPGASIGSVLGLTSERNRSFVERLDLYDRVATYDEIASLDPAIPLVLIDMAGDAAVRAALRARLGSGFLRSIGVGATHWERLAVRDSIGAYDSEAFFAPARIAKRIDDWGGLEFANRFGQAMSAFASTATQGSTPWLRVCEKLGADALASVYEATLQGHARPEDGFILGL